MSANRCLAWLLAVLLVGTTSIGCANRKVTKANFDKIQKGMSLQDVEKLLGKGEKQEGDGSNVAGQFGVAVGGPAGSRNAETYTWESGDKKITVYFMSGKVGDMRMEGQ